MAYYYRRVRLRRRICSFLPTKLYCLWMLLIAISLNTLHSQDRFRGRVIDDNDEPIVGAAIQVLDASIGGYSSEDGVFSIRRPTQIPFQVKITFSGHEELVQQVDSLVEFQTFVLKIASSDLKEVVIFGTALSDRKNQQALTMETMSLKAIEQTSAASAYEGLGHLPGVDINSASFGLKVVNTRGFNSTQPVRSLQLIDGVDNQSPGLNFSLGNFLGASELDLELVDLVMGASSAFYGPNAFNGVIAMKTKSPFLHRGLAVTVKGGERNWLETAIRYAKVFENKDGEEKFAFKVNLFYLRADDWEANNLAETYRDTSEVNSFDYVGEDNPGGYDAVNVYGDEIFGIADELGGDLIQRPGLGKFFRTGYEEKDLLDYDTRNLKAAVSLHYKFNPDVELIASSNYSNGTTVFQGINRVSFRDIQFFQHKVELRGKRPSDQFFARAYVTHEDAGNSYDPVFTAFRLQEMALNDQAWRQAYQNRWTSRMINRVKGLEGYPPDPSFPDFRFDFAKQREVLDANQDQLTTWHQEVREVIDGNRLVPGTPEFQAAFDSITSLIITKEGGTRFYDKSALYHGHAEYKMTPDFGEITFGGNARLYTPVTAGSIFADTGDVRITNLEFGLYTGIKKQLFTDRLTLTGTLRLDKNQNFRPLLSPAVTAAVRLSDSNPDHILRTSFSSAIRNPTLADQYLYYNVGSAILVGNISGYEDLIELESLREFLNTRNPEVLEYIDIPSIQPERVSTIEVGYRNLIRNRLYIDAGYYFSRYQDFIGFQFAYFGSIQFNFPVGQVYRVSANAQDIVTTQGASLSVNYYLGDQTRENSNKFVLGGNYSWNVLNTATDDPIVPAFNTPEHKFNVNFSGRELKLLGIKGLGFNVNYKWVQGFLFEGSPQFTGLVPNYDLLDVQVNKEIPRIHTIIKIGASNVLNNQVFTVYGGPRIGRLAYVQLTYNFDEKN
jgi:iron complex outermembrane receptor protein